MVVRCPGSGGCLRSRAAEGSINRVPGAPAGRGRRKSAEPARSARPPRRAGPRRRGAARAGPRPAAARRAWRCRRERTSGRRRADARCCPAHRTSGRRDGAPWRGAQAHAARAARNVPLERPVRARRGARLGSRARAAPATSPCDGVSALSCECAPGALARPQTDALAMLGRKPRTGCVRPATSSEESEAQGPDGYSPGCMSGCPAAERASAARGSPRPLTRA